MEKIRMNIILEIMGRPKEHIVESLNLLIEKLSKENATKIISKEVKEPIEVKEAKDLFSTFAEVELEVDNIETCLGLIFAYMPANVEISSPEEILIKNTDLNFITNRLISRLHNYDALAKKIINERDFLIKKLKSEAPHLFKKEQDSKKDKKD